MAAKTITAVLCTAGTLTALYFAARTYLGNKSERDSQVVYHSFMISDDDKFLPEQPDK
jgi:hypothetical protein